MGDIGTVIMHQPYEQGAIPWEIIIGVSSIVISVVALVTSIIVARYQRQHNRNSVRPYLDFDLSIIKTYIYM